MSDITNFLPGIQPIGGIVPVSSAISIASNPTLLMADGSDIVATDYPLVAASLPAATTPELVQLIGNVNLSSIGYGNGLYIAATGALGSNMNVFSISYSEDCLLWRTKPITFPLSTALGNALYITQIKYLNGNWYLAMSPGTTGINPYTTGSATGTNPGKLFRSTDGFHWVEVLSSTNMGYKVNSASSYDYYKINVLRYLNGVYFAGNTDVNLLGTAYTSYATSTDGITWTEQTPTTLANFCYNGIAYGASVYVAVGFNQCMSSSNGTTWTNRSNSPTTAYWADVAYGAGCFISVMGWSNATSTTVGYSTNGITWTTKTIPVGRYQKVVFANSLFVAIGYSVCSTSPDGITWTSRTVPSLNWCDLDYDASSGFVAVANNLNSSTPTVMIQSDDGVTWTSNNITQSSNCSNVVYTTTYGFVSIDKATLYPMVSSTGESWSRMNSPTGTSSVNMLAANPAGTVFVIANGASLYYSTNLTSWSLATAGGVGGMVKWVNDRFVSFNPNGIFVTKGMYSYDGVKWYVLTVDLGAGNVPLIPLSAAYGNGTYVAVGMQSYAYTGVFRQLVESRGCLSSEDGVTWNSSFQLPASAIWTGVEYGNGIFVAISAKNQNAYSTAGGSVGASTFNSPAVSNSVPDVMGVSGRVCAVSKNGVDWQLSYMPVVGEWSGISFNGNVFIVVGNNSKCYAVSEDGFNWTIKETPVAANWNSIASKTSDHTSVVPSGDIMSGAPSYSTNFIYKPSSCMRITESATLVTLPYLPSSQGTNYAVKVK